MGQIISAGQSGQQQVARVDLTAAQLKTLGDTPVTLVPAPGTGNMIVPVSVVFRLAAGAHRFQGAGNLRLLYGGSGVGSVGTSGTLFADVVTQTTDQVGLFSQPLIFSLAPNAVTGDYTSKAAVNAKALQISGVNFDLGSVLTATVADGGTGYAVNDLGSLSAGDNNAVYKVLTAPGGVVGTVQITSGGANYDLLSNPVSTSVDTGAGDGALTLNIATIQQGDGTATVETYYIVVPLS